MSTRWDTIKETSNGRLWHAPDNDAYVFGITQIAVDNAQIETLSAQVVWVEMLMYQAV